MLFLIFFIKNLSNKSIKIKHSLIKGLYQLFEASFRNLSTLTNSKSYDNRFKFNNIINLFTKYIFIKFKIISRFNKVKISILLFNLFFN